MHFFKNSKSSILGLNVSKEVKDFLNKTEDKIVKVLMNDKIMGKLESGVYALAFVHLVKQAAFGFSNDLWFRGVFGEVGAVATLRQLFSKRGHDKIEGDNIVGRMKNAASNPDKHVRGSYFSIATIPFIASLTESFIHREDFQMAFRSNLILTLPYLVTFDHYLNNREFQKKKVVENEGAGGETSFAKSSSKYVKIPLKYLNTLEVKSALFFLAYNELRKQGADIGDVNLEGASIVAMVQSVATYLVNKGKQLVNVKNELKNEKRELAK